MAARHGDAFHLSAAMRLEVERLTYRAGGRTLIDDVSFVSESRRCTALLGANGAGKSLLLRLCHGLLQPHRGRIHWDGHPPRALGSSITMIFQKPVMLRRSVRANVAHALYIQGVPRARRDARVEAALELVGLGDCIEQAADVLSGGQQQRLAIARAWALQPATILMDEPTARLDTRSTERVERIIRGLHDEGIKILITSHNLAQVRRLCGEVVFLHEGRLVQHSRTDDFFALPANDMVCEFIRSQTF